MKVRIYKAPDGKGKLVKAKDGMAVNTDKEIKKKIAEGKEPEIIIYEMAEFGLSRDQARDKVYKLYDLLGDDEYDEDEPTAPYDQPVEDEVAEAVVEEEEPDNAAIYDYYGGDNQGLDVVNDGADDEDEEEARYGGQYAEGGQFAPGSIIPKPKKPYYIGMDAEPYDNAYKFGGLTKGAYVKKRIKELRKAAQGEEVKNNETNISPRGTIDSPAGFTSPEKNLASIIKQTANEAVMKQQAENEYQQYQDSTMGEDFNGKFLFGGRNRKIRRANRAMFGTPFAMPGVDVNYEFGPLGGLRKAEANWDLDAIGDLAKLLPGAMNMMPGMFPGVFPGMMPGMMSYKKVSYPAQVRKKTITTINNAALDEVANQNPNSTAAQNNRSDKKNEIKCPPGAVYDPSLGHCIDQEGNRVRSIIDLPDPEELLGNPFENPNARMLNGKKTMKATGPSSSASSNASAMITQAQSVGGAPLQSEQALMSSSMNPVLNSQDQELSSNVPAASDASAVNSSPYSLTPKQTGSQTEEFCYPGQSCYQLSDDQSWDRNIFNELPEALTAYGANNKSDWFTDNDEFNKTKLDLSKVTKKEAIEAIKSRIPKQDLPRIKNLDEYIDKWLKFQKENQKAYGSTNTIDLYDYDFSGDSPKYADWLNVSGKAGAQNPYDIFGATPALDFQDYEQAFGGSINNVQPDQYGNLQKFIYGGDEYAYGGDVLPKANNGYITNFQKQMNATKDRIDQMGNKKPEELLGNPFRVSPFGNATTGIESNIKGPFGTTWPNSKPNTGTTTQDGTGTTTNTNQSKTTTTTNQGQPQFDPNTMAQFQQYMQMMQGQPGMGQGQFSVGRPQRLGFGLSRDFNYSSGFSPVNWQVPEGTKGVKQTSYKDRGKWYNPFDTKRITEWRIDNGEAVPTDPSKTGTQDGTGTNVNPKGKPGTTDKAMDEATYGPSAEVEGVQDDPFGIGMDAENEEAYDYTDPVRGAEDLYKKYNQDWKTYNDAPEGTASTEITNLDKQQEASDRKYRDYISNMPEDVRAKNYKKLNKIAGYDMIGKEGNITTFFPDTDEEEIVGIGNKGEVIDSPQFYNERNTQRYTGTDIDGEKMYETYTDKDRLNDVFDITGFSKKDFRNQGPALFGDTQGGTRSELADEYESKGFFGKRKMRKDFMKNDLWDMPLDSGVINERRGNAEIVPNTDKGSVNMPGATTYNLTNPEQNTLNKYQSPIGLQNDPLVQQKAWNESGYTEPANDDPNRGTIERARASQAWKEQGIKKASNRIEVQNPFNDSVLNMTDHQFSDGSPALYDYETGRYNPVTAISQKEYGGYVPEYMAYGGYIPMARSGITAGKPEFEDPNLIGRTVEQSAYTFKPGQLATDLFSGPTSLTGLTTNILNARDEGKKMNQAAQMSRTSDAATANTGQSGFGSAERKGSDLMASGNETQYGSTPGKQGYEGGLYGKKGGSMNTQYAKGKVYSLTMDQIKAIEAAGGKVEYIK
jgi:hypothetical protein